MNTFTVITTQGDATHTWEVTATSPAKAVSKVAKARKNANHKNLDHKVALVVEGRLSIPHQPAKSNFSMGWTVTI
jgi:hypothetical protein